VEGGAEVGQAEAARHHLGVDFVAGFGVCGKHLAGDLCVAGFVCSNEAEAVAAEEWSEAEEQKKAADEDQNDELPDGDGSGQL
jgi:hypothetical protein